MTNGRQNTDLLRRIRSLFRASQETNSFLIVAVKKASICPQVVLFFRTNYGLGFTHEVLALPKLHVRLYEVLTNFLYTGGKIC